MHQGPYLSPKLARGVTVSQVQRDPWGGGGMGEEVVPLEQPWR